MWDCQQLIGLKVAATDGEVGQLTDLCFDDECWQIRYVIVNTDAANRQMAVALDVQNLADDLVQADGDRGRVVLEDDTEAAGGERLSTPVHDAWWRGLAGRSRPTPADGPTVTPGGSAHLQRIEEVRGCRVAATDGDIGSVEGFLISESSWAIEYVIVQTLSADGPRRMVVLPSWITRIDRLACTVQLCVARATVMAGPEFTEDIHAAYEAWFLSELPRQACILAH